ncbi:DUF5681 domain-containing protein [Erythrobacter aurantius]|uniref:DUF5681 domain-containing protein n=1 Tax=Erythrobacter aurantius TaxID=2909249 RepID=UPI00207AB49A|nr:DUF5681 domain-containing protein [Erythrobacter aurantius]
MPKDDYEVGYGKPPKHTRFKKGQSGNPKGRKKGSKNYKTIIAKVFAEPITITVNGERRTVSSSEALSRVLITKGLKGNIQALRDCHKLQLVVENDLEAAEVREVDLQKVAARARKLMGAKDEKKLE